MKELKVYLKSIIESFKDEKDAAYLIGYRDAHKDILEKIERDEKFLKEKVKW